MNSSLTDRQRVEKLYHDEKYKEGAAAHEESRRIDRALERFWQLVGRPSGLTILDFGCGDGWVSINLAKQGNRMFGFDLSHSLVEKAKALAERSNVAAQTDFREMAAETLDYPDDTFDMIVGTSILHHTDLEVALRRMRAVLKPSGTAIFLEPLNQNIALRLWRALTPWRRTETERAFTSDDIAAVRRLFPATRFTYCYLTSIFTTGLILMAPKNRLLHFLNDRLADLDDRLLAAFPALGKFSAVAIMEMRK